MQPVSDPASNRSRALGPRGGSCSGGMDGSGAGSPWPGGRASGSPGGGADSAAICVNTRSTDLATSLASSAVTSPSRCRSRSATASRPASYNTINKWAHGISDTYALGILAETTGLGVPTVVLPFVNSALAGRAPFRRNVESLRAEGVRILLGGPGGVQPHEPHTGGTLIDTYPWHLALDEAGRLVSGDRVSPDRL